MANIRIEEASRAPVELRNAYLDLLLEPQEFFVERLVQSGQSFLFLRESTIIGYAVKNGDTIVEFFVVDCEAGTVPFAFDAILATTRAARALCKTFDPQMFAAAGSRSAKTKTTGYLFRQIVDKSFVSNSAIKTRLGTKNDINLVLSFHDGFFDSPEEIENYITDNGLFLYQTASGQATGCGIFKRVIVGRSDFDVGMVVSPAHRRKGLGSYIVSHLKSHLLNSGFRPICGCSADNLASKLSLEKAGFAAAHRLIEFEY
jgi:GNAT superfamily N-acetyltransferase